MSDKNVNRKIILISMHRQTMLEDKKFPHQFVSAQFVRTSIRCATVEKNAGTDEVEALSSKKQSTVELAASRLRCLILQGDFSRQTTEEDQIQTHLIK